MFVLYRCGLNMETYLNSGRQVEYHSNFVIEGNTVGEEWLRISTIRGWLTRREAECLQDYARGKSVLEIGSYAGRSTVAMATVAKFVGQCRSSPGRCGDRAGGYLQGTRGEPVPVRCRE